MKHLQSLLARLRGGRRPPTGPLTTAEKATADERRTQTLLNDERIERKDEHDERP